MKNVLFLGQRQIAWRALEIMNEADNRAALPIAVFVTDEDTYRTASEKLTAFSPKFISNEKRNEDLIVSSIRENGIDVVISIQHNWILSQKVLEAVCGRAFNLHNARLPHYQGYNSISHAILNGDTTYHSTIHWMEELVDSGDIVIEGLTPIAPDETALSLHRKTIQTAAGIFATFTQILRGEDPLPRIKLENVESKFYGKNSLKELLDATGVDDAARRERLARASFYPPHNMAYVKHGDNVTYLLPASGVGDLREAGLKGL
jgi:methionyl-tRNA formyltransferase